MTEEQERKDMVHDLLSCVLDDKMTAALREVDKCEAESIATEEGELLHDKTIDPSNSLDYLHVLNTRGCNPRRTTEIMESAGARYIGGGTGREVYKYGNCVVKRARNVGHRGDNIREDTVWEMSNPKIRQLLTPVVQMSGVGTFVTMPYVTIPDNFDERIKIANTLSEELRNAGYYCSDVHTGNVGELKGKPVLIDYGYGITSCSKR